MKSGFLMRGPSAGAIGLLMLTPTFTLLPPAAAWQPTSVALVPGSDSAEPTQSLLLIVGGLLALLLVVLFWRIIRQRRAPTQPTGPAKAAVPPPTTTAPVAASLEFIDATGNSVSIALTRPLFTIGRANDNDIVIAASLLNADTVSQHHAQVRRDQDDYIVRDLGSKNGLTVNGRHTLRNLLQDGDRVGFGAAEAVFHNPAASGSPAHDAAHGPGGAA